MGTPASSQAASRSRCMDFPIAVANGAMAASSRLRRGSGTTLSQSTSALRPNPWQFAHAPSGLLKLSRAGAISGKRRPHPSQAKPCLKRIAAVLGSPRGRTQTSPPPRAKALATPSDKRTVSSSRAGSPGPNSARTTRSMSRRPSRTRSVKLSRSASAQSTTVPSPSITRVKPSPESRSRSNSTSSSSLDPRVAAI